MTRLTKDRSDAFRSSLGDTHGNLLPEKELRTLFLLAINFGIQQFNRGEERYIGEVFELYRTALDRGFLLNKGQLSRFAFKNIVGIAIHNSSLVTNCHRQLEKIRRLGCPTKS